MLIPLFCFAILCVLSSFAIIPLVKRELVAILLMGSECHVSLTVFTLPPGDVVWSIVEFLYVIMTFPDHTQLPLLRPGISESQCFMAFVCLILVMHNLPIDNFSVMSIRFPVFLD